MNTVPEAIRDAVHARTDELRVPPVPWPALRRRHRRATARTVAIATTSVVAVGAALVSVGGPAGVRDLVGLDSSVVAPADDGDAVPRGRLAADPAWVARMLRHAATSPFAAPDRVLFADDVGGTRLALVHHKAPEDIALWYSGPAGAPPEQLEGTTGDSRARAYPFVVPPATTDPGHATVLLVGPGGGRMSVWTNNDVGADGAPRSGVVAGHEVEPGVYTVRLRVPFPQVDVRLTGLPGGDWRSPASGPTGFVPNPPRLSDAQWWPAAAVGARGAVTSSPPAGLGVQQLYDQLGLRSDVPGSRVLWVGSGPAAGHAVLALRAPSGGWAVVATDDGTLAEAVKLQPAQPADRLTLAWYLLDQPDPGFYATPSDELAVVGPAAAVTARVTADDGRTVDVPLQQGAASGRVRQARQVAFLDGAGTTLATTDVTPEWRLSGPLNGQR